MTAYRAPPFNSLRTGDFYIYVPDPTNNPSQYSTVKLKDSNKALQFSFPYAASTEPNRQLYLSIYKIFAKYTDPSSPQPNQKDITFPISQPVVVDELEYDPTTNLPLAGVFPSIYSQKKNETTYTIYVGVDGIIGKPQQDYYPVRSSANGSLRTLTFRLVDLYSSTLDYIPWTSATNVAIHVRLGFKSDDFERIGALPNEFPIVSRRRD